MQRTSTVPIKITSNPENRYEGEISQNFQQSLYRGIFTEIDGQLNIQRAILNLENYNENVTFALSGTDSAYFEITKIANAGTISLKSDVTTEMIMQQKFYIFNVDALEHENLIATTNIIITTEEIEGPEFNKNFYVGTFNHSLTHEAIIVNGNNIEVSLSGSNLFDISINGNVVTVFLRDAAIVPDDVKNFVLNLNARSLTTNKTAESVLVVTVETEFEARLEFNQNLYQGQISKDLILSHELILLNSLNFDITIAGEYAELFTFTINDDNVQLNLANPEGVPKDDSYIKITLTASAVNFLSAQTTVIIGFEKHNSTQLSKSFEQSLYGGTFSELTRILSISTVIFDRESYNSNISFRLTGIDSRYFDLNSEENQLTILLRSEVTTENMIEQNFYIFTVEAQEHGNLVAITNIIVRIEKIEPPKFNQNFYTGTFNHTLKHELIQVQGNNVEVSLNPENYFEISIVGNEVTINPRSDVVIPDDRKSFILTLYAKSLNKTANSALFITVDTEFQTRLEFSKKLYEGHISKLLALSHEPIIVNSEIFTIEISGTHSEFITAIKNGNSVELGLKNQENFPKDASYLQVTLKASAENALDDLAVVTLSIEKENSTEIDLTQPYFEIGNFLISIFKNQTGNIASIRALVPDGSSPTYDLNFIESLLADKLNLISGDLILVQAIPPGVYTLTALAFNNGKNATARITLNVLEYFCDGDTHVQKTLTIKHLKENGVYDNILYSKIDGCEYEIFSVVPSNYRCE